MSRHLLWYTVDVYTQKSDKGSFLEYKISKVCKLSVYIHSDEYVHVLIAILFREKKRLPGDFCGLGSSKVCYVSLAFMLTPQLYAVIVLCTEF
jgi:hypothetical protein